MAALRKSGSFTLPAITLTIAALIGSCTEPQDPADPGGAPPTAQVVETGLQQQDSASARPTPTTDEKVHVRADEFEISGPYAHENLAFFLLHSDSRRTAPRPVLTLEEALQKKVVKVHETGDVQQLAIENLTDDADIWVQAGDIVQGGKQDRVLSKDLLVPPKSGKVALDSFCVEQGRWSGRNSDALTLMDQELGEDTGISSALDATQFGSSRNSISSKELKKAVRLANAQQEVWSEVRGAQAKLIQNVDTSVVSKASATSLELTLSNRKVHGAIENYEKQLGTIPAGKQNVVGFAFSINGKLNSAEVYASPELFAKLWGKMLRAAAVEAVSVRDEKRAATPPVTADAVRAFLTIAKDTQGRGTRVNDRMQSVLVNGKQVVFQETRDRQADTAWVHRSYFAK